MLGSVLKDFAFGQFFDYSRTLRLDGSANACLAGTRRFPHREDLPGVVHVVHVDVVVGRGVQHAEVETQEGEHPPAATHSTTVSSDTQRF